MTKFLLIQVVLAGEVSKVLPPLELPVFIYMDNGFVSLHRKLLDWEWYDDINVKVLFIHLLLKANWKEKDWHGINIKRGSFITSINTLATETNLSPMQVRVALDKLILTNEITKVSNREFTVITVNNYNLYQDGNTRDNKPVTNQEHTDNKPVTTTNKENKDNKDNKYIYVGLSSNDSIISEYKNFIDWYNKLFGKDFTATAGRLAKYKSRRKVFSLQDLQIAFKNLRESAFHIGYNDKGTFYATPDFLLRSDEQIDRWKSEKNIWGGENK